MVKKNLFNINLNNSSETFGSQSLKACKQNEFNKYNNNSNINCAN